jgi:hypothetical protein
MDDRFRVTVERAADQVARHCARIEQLAASWTDPSQDFVPFSVGEDLVSRLRILGLAAKAGWKEMRSAAHPLADRVRAEIETFWRAFPYLRETRDSVQHPETAIGAGASPSTAWVGPNEKSFAVGTFLSVRSDVAVREARRFRDAVVPLFREALISQTEDDARD